MKFKAVLFDLDGTLLDTLDDLGESMNAVLSAAGLPTHETEMYKYFIGNGIRNLVKRALPAEMREDGTVDRFLQGMQAEYGRRWDEKTRPYDGIPALLDNLSEAGIRLSVLSNKADHFTKQIIEKLLSAWRFEAVLGERAEVPRKPDPAGALEISRKLGIPCNEFLYLGDSGVDMTTAVAAGMYPVGAMWGFRKAEELAEAGARVLIPRPGALLDLL